MEALIASSMAVHRAVLDRRETDAGRSRCSVTGCFESNQVWFLDRCEKPSSPSHADSFAAIISKTRLNDDCGRIPYFLVRVASAVSPQSATTSELGLWTTSPSSALTPPRPG